MLSLVATLCAQASPEQRERLAAAVSRWPILSGRRQGHRRCLAAAGIDSSAENSAEAVRRHLIWTTEFLAEMGGYLHPVEDRTGSIWNPDDRGRLLVTAHLGNWIVGARVLAVRLGVIRTIAGIQLQRRWQPQIHEHCGRHGIEFSDLAGMRTALGTGGVAAVHLDGHPGSYRQREIALGVRSAAQLATLTRPAVYAIVCRRAAPGRFVLEGVRLGDPPEHHSRAQRLGDWESRLTLHLRDWIRREPEDWLIFSPRRLRRPPTPTPSRSN